MMYGLYDGANFLKFQSTPITPGAEQFNVSMTEQEFNEILQGYDFTIDQGNTQVTGTSQGATHTANVAANRKRDIISEVAFLQGTVGAKTEVGESTTSETTQIADLVTEYGTL